MPRYMAKQRWLWHGTSESTVRVLKHGLLPDSRGYVFLTDNPDLAIAYGQSDSERTGVDGFALLRVDLKKVDIHNLVPDPDHEQWDEMGQEIETWQQSLRATDQVAYLGTIPARALKVEKIFKLE